MHQTFIGYHCLQCMILVSTKLKEMPFWPLKYLKPNWIALQVAKNYSSVGSALVEACMEVSPAQKRVSKECVVCGMGWIVSSQISCVEALTPSVTVSEPRAFRK